MEQWTHIVGFTRGGTSWIKTILSNHPEITSAPGENVIFRDESRWHGIEQKLIGEFGKQMYKFRLHLLTKAPLDMMHLDRWQLCCSNINIVVMMRDPRDCAASHHFGQRPWMNSGQNSTPHGVMEKLKKYLLRAEPFLTMDNLTVVKYEDLHMAPLATLEHLFKNMGIDSRSEVVEYCHQKSRFEARTGRRPGIEDPMAHLRKGIMGDWKRMDYDFSQYNDFIRDCGYEI